MSPLPHIWTHKAPHKTSSHHERNVVTECDYLFGPAIWLVAGDQVGKIPRSHWPVEVTWHQPWNVTGWKFYEKNESQAELHCQWPECLVLVAWSWLGLSCHNPPRDRVLPTARASKQLASSWSKLTFILLHIILEKHNCKPKYWKSNLWVIYWRKINFAS